jgi:hypothetical protein
MVMPTTHDGSNRRSNRLSPNGHTSYVFLFIGLKQNG